MALSGSAMLSYTEARQKVIEVVGAEAAKRTIVHETSEIELATGRVLSLAVAADRDYPPFDRATRDGYALRASDAAAPGATLECVGEIRAGGEFKGAIAPQQCVEIMTGAAVPAGLDAVAMIEHTRREGNRVAFERAAAPGEHIVPRGSEAAANSVLLRPGARLGYAELAVAAQVGATRLRVFAKPRVAILSTGDEVVDARATPGPLQVRNSNGITVETMARMADAESVPLGNARDDLQEIRKKIERGLQEDLLVLSGGVSMGKYDLVEKALAVLGAKFHFTGVAIRPGRPAVFATCGDKSVFGLPGNPVSTMVTFELFVLPALDLLAGTRPRPLPILRARLASPVREKAGLAHFLPARIEWEGREPRVTQLPWQGSGDLVALATANAFLVIGPEKLEAQAGEWVDVLPRRGAL